jgi:hypothetical protein
VTRARRIVFFWVVLALLSAAAAFFIAHDEGRPGSPTTASTSGARARADRRVGARLRQRAAVETRRALEKQRRRAARRENPGSETAPPRPPGQASETRRAGEGVAERFYAAFSRYQRGELDPQVRRGVHAAATPAFAHELLRAPPRIPPGASVPDSAAKLSGLDFVQRRYRGSHLVGAEVVGYVLAAGRREPLAFELRRARRGWRVDALSR